MLSSRRCCFLRDHVVCTQLMPRACSCGMCCPRNFTEQHYHDNPALWPKHPAVFLAQTRKVDNHADGEQQYRCLSVLTAAVHQHFLSSFSILRRSCALCGSCACLPVTDAACVCRNYYDALISHGVKAELRTVSPHDERCYCIGSPGEPAAVGSPFVDRCTDDFVRRSVHSSIDQ